jgi:hypothetical protein
MRFLAGLRGFVLLSKVLTLFNVAAFFAIV